MKEKMIKIQNSCSHPSQMEMVMHWKARTPQAARNPKIDMRVVMVSDSALSSSSDFREAICVAATPPVPRGCVGGASCTVAVGRVAVLDGNGVVARGFVAVGAPRPGKGGAVFSGMVGAGAPGKPPPPVFNLMVGAGRGAPAAVLRGMVGAGAGGPDVLRGIPGAGPPGAVGAGMVAAGIVAAGGRVRPTVGVGGFAGTGGLMGCVGTTGAEGGTTRADAVARGAVGGATGAVGGATGAVGGAAGLTVAEGDAGKSLALSVTLTVSFFRGMLAVRFNGFSLSSLMGIIVCDDEKTRKDAGCQTRNSSSLKFFVLTKIYT